MVVQWCGYNDSNIRVAVIIRHSDGFTNGRTASGADPAYGQVPLRKFESLAAAKADVQTRMPTTHINWVEERS